MKLIITLALALAGCSQKNDAGSQQQPVTVVCSCAPPPAPPPPPPCTSDPSAAPAPTAETTAPKPASGTPIELARQAALRNEPATVRRHLEEKVRNGKGTPEEVNLVKQACKSMADKACQEDLKKKYPPPSSADPMNTGILF